METNSFPSNVFVRAIYCVCLVFVAFSLLRSIGVFNFKFAGGAILMLMLFMAVAPKVALLLVVVLRFIGVVNGKFRLNVCSTSGPIYFLRIVAVFLMIASLLVVVYTAIGTLTSIGSDRAGYWVVSGILGGGSPIGLLLFEASRILERDMSDEANAPT
jgi:hypothetical protein